MEQKKNRFYLEETDWKKNTMTWQDNGAASLFTALSTTTPLII